MAEVFERFAESINGVENPLVFEFGGCDGYHTNIMAKMLTERVSDFKYFVFEPVKELADRIRQTINWCPYVEVVEMAISDRIGETKLFKSDSKYYGSSSIIRPKMAYEFWEDMSFSESSCNTISLDDFVILKGLEKQKIDWIWADIQGAEKELILGAKATMNNVKYFFTEFGEYEIYENQIHDLEELKKMLPQFELIEQYKEDVLFKNISI